ncbi:MAG: type IV pilus modification protein PilV, partial [Candidatus Thiodiazotropha sp.]
MSYSHPQSPFNRSKGMTLVEVLIAAVIIGIGLLGIASLQVTALQGASNADYRSRAIDLSASLADRMRANRLGVAANSYSDANANATADCAAPPATVCAMTPSASAAPAQCTTLDMASFDMLEIRCRNGVQKS